MGLRHPDSKAPEKDRPRNENHYLARAALAIDLLKNRSICSQSVEVIVLALVVVMHFLHSSIGEKVDCASAA